VLVEEAVDKALAGAKEHPLTTNTSLADGLPFRYPAIPKGLAASSVIGLRTGCGVGHFWERKPFAKTFGI
tara:strand:+ start:36 stop:245 length:210 start_codon:yes stop_codon:yes gene_type:complete